MLSKRTFFLFVLLSFFSANNFAFSAEKKDGEFNMGEMIMHHVLDDYRYEIMHGVIIPLPIILYTDTGLEIFSSSNLFDEDHNALKEGYNGFKYDHGKLKPINPELSYIDLSITKNVAFLIMTSILMIIIFVSS